MERYYSHTGWVILTQSNQISSLQKCQEFCPFGYLTSWQGDSDCGSKVYSQLSEHGQWNPVSGPLEPPSAMGLFSKLCSAACPLQVLFPNFH